MQIDTAMVGVLITILLALLGFASWVGALHQKVKYNDQDNHSIRKEFKEYQAENKADHNLITSKLDKILQNGGHHNGRQS
jgi:hypothetical protein